MLDCGKIMTNTRLTITAALTFQVALADIRWFGGISFHPTLTAMSAIVSLPKISMTFTATV